MITTLQPHIEAAQKSAKELSALNSASPFVGNAISAFKSAADNLAWELQRHTTEAAKASAKKDEPAPKK